LANPAWTPSLQFREKPNARDILNAAVRYRRLEDRKNERRSGRSVFTVTVGAAAKPDVTQLVAPVPPLVSTPAPSIAKLISNYIAARPKAR